MRKPAVSPLARAIVAALRRLQVATVDEIVACLVERDGFDAGIRPFVESWLARPHATVELGDDGRWRPTPYRSRTA